MIHCMIKRCPKTFQLLWNQNSNILCIINTRARTIFSVQDYDKDFKVPPSNLKLDFRFALTNENWQISKCRESRVILTVYSEQYKMYIVVTFWILIEPNVLDRFSSLIGIEYTISSLLCFFHH